MPAEGSSSLWNPTLLHEESIARLMLPASTNLQRNCVKPYETKWKKGGI